MKTDNFLRLKDRIGAIWGCQHPQITINPGNPDTVITIQKDLVHGRAVKTLGLLKAYPGFANHKMWFASKNDAVVFILRRKESAPSGSFSHRSRRRDRRYSRGKSINTRT